MTSLARCQRNHGLSRIFFCGGETITIQFEEKYAKNESRALISISEWVPTNNPVNIQCRELYYVDSICVGVVLLWTGQGSVQGRQVSNAFQTAVLYQKPFVDDQRVPLIEPGNLLRLHFART